MAPDPMVRRKGVPGEIKSLKKMRYSLDIGMIIWYNGCIGLWAREAGLWENVWEKLRCGWSFFW